MKPMAPMKPMAASEPWWPKDLGPASSSGGQNSLRYAFFRDKHRLLIEHSGVTTVYDSANHDIRGISQVSEQERAVTFSSQHGTVDLGSLKRLD
jgi:hypothetical protein